MDGRRLSSSRQTAHSTVEPFQFSISLWSRLQSFQLSIWACEGQVYIEIVSKLAIFNFIGLSCILLGPVWDSWRKELSKTTAPPPTRCKFFIWLVLLDVAGLQT
jgi:hypothetical protein